MFFSKDIKSLLLGLINIFCEYECLKKREKLWMEYCDLLVDELGGQAVFMYVHGFRPISLKVKRGQRLRNQLGIKKHPILPDVVPLEEQIQEEINGRGWDDNFLPDVYHELRMSGKSKEEIKWEDCHVKK
jgi:hypothetical protein